jgi:hypothetical protein
MTAASTIEIGIGQPNSSRITSAMANRLTPAISTVATAKLSEFSTWVASLNRNRRYSGTLRTLLL